VGTDAAIQTGGGSGRLVGPYIEKPPDSDSLSCGIQLGDGGITDGNTEGTSSSANFTIEHPRVLVDTDPCEIIRLYNTSSSTILNPDLVGPDSGSSRYGIKVQDGMETASAVSVSGVTVIGGEYTNLDAKITGQDPSNSSRELVYYSGDVYQSTPASGDLTIAEVAYGSGTGPSGEDEIYFGNVGSFSRFTSDGTL